MLHVLNGDGTAAVFNKTGIQGEVLVWREALIMGPCPANLSVEEWIHVRASHLAEAYKKDADECVTSLRHQHELFDETAHDHDEIVLWFEFDLFCQTNLSCIVNGLAEMASKNLNLSLICIDAFPGVEHFKGLGDLNSAQLESLFASRKKVSGEMLALGAALWHGYTAPAPDTLEQLLKRSSSGLPYMHDAFLAHLARFPSTENGLGQVENTLLNLIAGGIDEFDPLFHMVGELEPIYGFGDLQICKHLEFMSGVVNPLLEVRGAKTGSGGLSVDSFAGSYFKLTDVGKAVLVGNSDMLNVNHVDYWLGGVRLDNDLDWRWDASKEQLLSI